MSRSYKKPFESITCIGTRSRVEKFYKNYTNRKIRRQKLRISFWFPIRMKNKFSNIFDYPKDGKAYRDDPKAYRK